MFARVCGLAVEGWASISSLGLDCQNSIQTDSLLANNPGDVASAVSFGKANKLKGLILAQNERWRRGLGMQVERIRRKAGQWRKGE